MSKLKNNTLKIKQEILGKNEDLSSKITKNQELQEKMAKSIKMRALKHKSTLALEVSKSNLT